MHPCTDHHNFLCTFELKRSISIVEQILTQLVLPPIHFIVMGTDSQQMHGPPLNSSNGNLILVIHIFHVLGVFVYISKHLLTVIIAPGIAIGKVDF